MSIILAFGWQRQEDLEFRVRAMLYQSGHPNLKNRKGNYAELTFAFPEIAVEFLFSLHGFGHQRSAEFKTL